MFPFYQCRLPSQPGRFGREPCSNHHAGAGQIVVSRYQIAQDPLNFLVDDRGLSDFDIKHRLMLDYAWDVPSLRRAWGWPAWLDDWQLSGILVAQSGQPFTIFAGPIFGELTQRVNVLGPVDVDSGNPVAAISSSNLELASLACLSAGSPPFATPSPGGSLFDRVPGTPCVGNSRRNAFAGPGFFSWDFAVQKRFPLGRSESRFVIVRVEVYNLTNWANYYNPISAFSLDGFNVNHDFGLIKSSHDPRQFQFAIRFVW